MMTTRDDFVSLCRSTITDPIAEENAILSIGLQFLPACAREVLAGRPATSEYWAFLCLQVRLSAELVGAELVGAAS